MEVNVNVVGDRGMLVLGELNEGRSNNAEEVREAVNKISFDIGVVPIDWRGASW